MEPLFNIKPLSELVLDFPEHLTVREIATGKVMHVTKNGDFLYFLNRHEKMSPTGRVEQKHTKVLVSKGWLNKLFKKL